MRPPILANTVALRARVEAGEVAGPRILTAGGALFPKDGIPIYLRDMPPEFLASLSQPGTVEEALEDVQANLDGGADATKLFLMTPQGNGRYAFMQPDIALAAADETHRRNRLVLAHPTDIEGINLAIEAGVDVLVHTTIGEGKTVWDPPLIAQMLSKNMALVPTLQLFPYELKRAGLEQRIVDFATGDAVEQLRAYSKAGGAVLFGTDVGYMSEYDPTEEYRLMARALSPMQILSSLTTAPALRWKEDGRRGRIEPGKDADLVVLDADPAKDVGELREGALHHPRRQDDFRETRDLGGYWKICQPSHQAAAAISAEAGIVTTQAAMMLPATPQRTARTRCALPTPMIEPVIVCVVDTGIPKYVAMKSEIAPPVSAAKPPIGFSLVMRWPMVFTMRQPPKSVPNAIAT